MISSSELRDCVMSLSETMSVEEANALLAEIDPEGDGQVDIKVSVFVSCPPCLRPLPSPCPQQKSLCFLWMASLPVLVHLFLSAVLTTNYINALLPSVLRDCLPPASEET